MYPPQLLAGARTVAQVAIHFDELKPAALALRDLGTASARGYFAPLEDDQVRQLLVTYWHARNALYDLVVSFRRDETLAGEWRPAAFLVAYSAAVLLVDAARFLRETFRDTPIVRARLNEPDESFGLPANIYDQVQHSLTGLRNAWHLYHAQRYFDTHSAELKAIAAREPFDAAWRILERHEERVRVPASRFASAMGKVRAREIASAVDQALVGRAIYGLLKLSGTLVADRYTRLGHCPSLPVEIRQQITAQLRPGDVMVTRKEHALTNYFLPGYWPHAILYLGQPAELQGMGLHNLPHIQPRWARLLAADGQEPRRVLESMRDGVFIRPLDSPFSNDAIVVLRPVLSPGQIAEGLSRGLAHEGKPYDFDFDFTRSDRLVCTEVVYRSYDGLGGMRFSLTRRAGRMTLAAVDLLGMAIARRGFEIVRVYAPTFSPDLLTGTRAQEVLAATLGERMKAEG
ncbi:MAG: YiiX/YebB-like N1pC/P60 family cysteine hydrolase [Pirellulales bacterium]